MQRVCPTCGKSFECEPASPSRPFCTPRCKMADLGNWLNEVYRISRPLDVDDLAREDAPEGPVAVRDPGGRWTPG